MHLCHAFMLLLLETFSNFLRKMLKLFPHVAKCYSASSLTQNVIHLERRAAEKSTSALFSVFPFSGDVRFVTLELHSGTSGSDYRLVGKCSSSACIRFGGTKIIGPKVFIPCQFSVPPHLCFIS